MRTKMHRNPVLRRKHQFRLALVGHKAVEAGSACLLLMVQGQIAQVTVGHFVIASQTGLLTVAPLVGITLTRFARHFANRWISAALVGACSFFADALIHRSHYPGKFTEAALTAAGTFVLSIAVSYTPVGKKIDRLAEAFEGGSHGPTGPGHKSGTATLRLERVAKTAARQRYPRKKPGKKT